MLSLADVRFLEASSAACPLALQLAIGMAGRIAADLGAAVSVVDSVVARRDAIGPRIDGHGALALFLDRGKQRLVSANVTAEDVAATGEAAAATGCAHADVILCDTDFHLRHATHAPGAVWAVVEQGVRDAVHSEFTLMAATGLLDLVGDAERPPLRLGGHQLAFSAGLALYGAAVVALAAQRAGQAPGVVRVTLTDVAVWLNWKSVALAAQQPARGRAGAVSEWCTLRCADGWFALVYREADWPVLQRLVGDARLQDPRLADRSERRRSAALINGILATHFAPFTRAQLRALALEQRLPLGPVWAPEELEDDAQMRARGFLVREPQEHGASILGPRLPVRAMGGGECS